jgi:hypothetical protein
VRRPCPACLEPVRVGATRCPSCREAIGTLGRFLDPRANCASCLQLLLLAGVLLAYAASR